MKACYSRYFVLGIIFLAFLSLPNLAKSPVCIITRLNAEISAKGLIVSLHIDAPYEESELRDALTSTRPITFIYYFEIYVDRKLRVDRRIFKIEMNRVVQFDNLTRQFNLQIFIGKKRISQIVVDTYDEVKAFLSDVENLNLGDIKYHGDEPIICKVKVHLLDDFVLWIIPWDVETSWYETNIKRKEK